MKKIKFALIIIVLVFAVISALYLSPVFDYLEYKSYDMRVRFWTRNDFTEKTGTYVAPSEEVIVVLVDSDSVDWTQQERGWGWPWPRKAYAEIVEYFNLAGAKSVAFDILYIDPSVYRDARQDEIIDNAINTLRELEESGYFAPRASAQGQQSRERNEDRAPGSNRERVASINNSLRSLSAGQDDESFVSASRDYGRVVQAVMISSERGTAKPWPSEYNLPLFRTENFGSMLDQFGINVNEEKGEEVKLQLPINGLIESAGALGSVTSIADSDSTYRRLKPFTLYNGNAIPSLTSASFIVSGMEPKLTYDEKNRIIQWEHFSIPVDKNGSALLRFRGGLEEYHPIMANVILHDLEAIKNGREPLLNINDFKDTYVFVGVFGEGFFDFFSTPISSTYPGVGAHVTMMDNMLKGDFIRESTRVLDLFILFGLVVLLVLLTMYSPRISLSLIGMAIVVVAIVISAFTAYQFGNLWIPMITYLAGTLASFVTVTLYNYATEGSQKRFIKSAFSQYLSPKVIEQIIADPSQLKLGGEKREMTAIFTDVRGFSTFSEALGDPSKLVELLNFYLTKMSNIVLDNQGTIDKYEGDAIIAFFGAPIHYPDHAALACRAVIDMKKAEPEINREAIETGLVTPAVIEAMYKKGLTKGLDDPCQIFTRIGMNTGDMVVGNMGTPNKMDYTIMGNAVNLAARLEGVNKQYNTGGILISEYTRDNLKASGHADEFIVRPLSRVRVVGINTPLRLYELLDTAADAAPQLLEMVKNWTQAFDLYEQRDFNAAGKLFESIFTKDPNDMAAKKYLDRCNKYSSAPPDEKTWDNGVDNLTEK